jgi:hypothetical protein
MLFGRALMQAVVREREVGSSSALAVVDWGPKSVGIFADQSDEHTFGIRAWSKGDVSTMNRRQCVRATIGQHGAFAGHGCGEAGRLRSMIGDRS